MDGVRKNLKCVILITNIYLTTQQLITIRHLSRICYKDGENIVLPTENQITAGPCSAWEPTCCSAENSKEIEKGTRIELNLCGKTMSEKCQKRFQRKMCFQDCSPFIGPWQINLTEPRRRTRIQFVPLCRKECEMWWNDCKDDMAEKLNWYPEGKEVYETAVCETIEKKYKDSTYFCEHAFGPFEFLVVPDFVPCASLFDDLHDNQYLAEWYGQNAMEDRRIFNFSGSYQIPQNDEQSSSPDVELIISSFFGGVIITTIGFAIGCIVINKCRNGSRQRISRIDSMEDCSRPEEDPQGKETTLT